MSLAYRPTLESLERREVFSADLAVCLAEAPVHESIAPQVALGDVNGDGRAVLAVNKGLAFAGDGIGLVNLLPFVEQENLVRFQGGCNGNTDSVDAVYCDMAGRGTAALLPYMEQDNLYKQASAISESLLATEGGIWDEADRQQIIAILIGLLQKSGDGGSTQRMTDVTDGTSNTLLAGVIRDATPEQRSQIIAILIG
jgi:hypothetical protein